MYKVFVHNKVIIFSEVKSNEGKNAFVIKEKKALRLRDELLFLRSIVSKNVPFVISSRDARKAMDAFFADFLKVEAAGGMVRRKNKYLFMKRHGVWDLPKGKVDPGERGKEAARREIEEECGIRCSSEMKKIGDSYHVYDCYGENTLKRTKWYACTYPGDKKLKVQKEEGISKAKWVSKEAALHLKKKSYPSLEAIIDCYFESLD
ncbi:MAG: NUDIX domain-containing protein [Bacteroidetes bacterium]|nr:MAG: NUDIX domain-containing protein [Bacteroidota bacterium]